METLGWWSRPRLSEDPMEVLSKGGRTVLVKMGTGRVTASETPRDGKEDRRGFHHFPNQFEFNVGDGRRRGR